MVKTTGREEEGISPRRRGDAEKTRDTYGVRALRAAGASRTCRRAFPAANSLNRIWVAVGCRLDGLPFLRVPSMLDSRISYGATISAIRSPKGVLESIPSSSSRRHH